MRRLITPTSMRLIGMQQKRQMIKTTPFNARYFSTTNSTLAPSETKLMTKEELERLIDTQEEDYVLIDVRNPEEVNSADMPLIETAVNIPLPDFGSAMLMMDDTRFKHQYGFNKPKSDEKVILYCRSGVRSAQAAEILKELNFENVYNYRGSAMDWYKR